MAGAEIREEEGKGHIVRNFGFYSDAMRAQRVLNREGEGVFRVDGIPVTAMWGIDCRGLWASSKAMRKLFVAAIGPEWRQWR